MVVVRDTISSLYDLTTLKIGAASNPYTFTIEPNNVLQWVFKDILLPDSTTNEAESHGFLTFSIERKKDLFIGDSLSNKAEIYFDYNPEIITNWATTTIVEPKVSAVAIAVNKEAVVYPNPASGNITVSSPKQGIVLLYNPTGGLILKKEVHEGLNQLTLPELNKGIYLLELKNKNQNQVSKLVIE